MHDGPGADVALSLARDGKAETRINADGSPVELLVIPTNEELPIARAMQGLVGA
jgi:acetate kinase